jgi:hypothetical protein
MMLLGILYVVFIGIIRGEFLEIFPGGSAIIFGLWVKGVYQYSPHNLTHGGFLQELWAIAGNSSKLIADLESHWVLLGLAPALVLAGYWYTHRDEAGSIFVGVTTVTALVMLVVTVIWMYYAPHMPSMMATWGHPN